MGAVIEFTSKDFSLIKRTVARDCTDDEFNTFMHICRHTGLDPIKRQIYLFVFHKTDPAKRNMVIVTSIAGYRTIAERTSNYRPDDRAPRIEYDPALKSPANPLGIVRAEVTVYKRAHGDWFPVTAEAYWDEYAPVFNGVVDQKKTGWVKMARVMIAKCAEAQALRKAWPDDFSGLYEETEVDREMVDITPSEIAAKADAERKLGLIGGKDAITVDWNNGSALTRVPFSQFADALLAHANNPTLSAMEVRAFWHRNMAGRGEFKAKAGHDYLELQKEIERITEAKEQAEVNQEAAE